MFNFTINPPWYRSVFAYFVYVILLIVFIYIIIKIYKTTYPTKHSTMENIYFRSCKTIVNQNSELDIKIKRLQILLITHNVFKDLH